MISCSALKDVYGPPGVTILWGRRGPSAPDSGREGVGNPSTACNRGILLRTKVKGHRRGVQEA